MASEREEIVITQDGVATYKRKLVVGDRERVMDMKSVRAGALFPAFGEIPMLPTGCRFSYTNENTTIFVLEDPPRVRTISWNTKSTLYNNARKELRASNIVHLWGENPETLEISLRNQELFRIAFPWLVRIYCFKNGAFVDMRVWYRSQKITSETDELFEPNLPNRGDDGRFCNNSDANRITREKYTSLALAVDAIESYYWGSEWNDHWMDHFNIDAKRLPEVSSPWVWEHNSLVNPDFVLSLPWRSAERTVGDEMRTLIGVAALKTEEDTFRSLVTRVQSAEMYDKTEIVIDAKSPVASSVRTIVLADGSELSIGDTIVFSPRAPILPQEVRCGISYSIEWFGVTEIGRKRSIKFVGIQKPICLLEGGRLVSWAKISERIADATEYVVAGVTLTKGTRCRFVDRTLWPEWREGGQFRIRRIARDGLGTMRAWLCDNQNAIVIGDTHGFVPGIEFLPLEVVNENGHLVAETYTLGDGTTLRVGDEFWYDTRMERIEAFVAMDGGRMERVCATVSGESVIIELRNGKLNPNIVLATTIESSFMVNGVRIKVGSKILSGGRVVVITRFSPLVNHKRYVQLGDDNLYWYFFSNGNDKLGATFEIFGTPVVRSHEVFHKLTRIDAPGTFFDPRDNAVHSIVSFRQEGEQVIGEEHNGKTFLVGEKGTLRTDLVPVYTRWFLGGRRRPGTVAVHHGDRLRLRDAIGTVGTIPAGKRFLVSHIMPIAKIGESPMVVFTNGLGFSLTRENASHFDVRRRKTTTWSRLADSSPVEQSKTKPNENLFANGFTRIFYRERVGSIVCVNLGCVIGTDHTGNFLHVGDRVRVVDPSSENLDNLTLLRMQKLADEKQIFRIVHVGQNWCGIWLWLSAGKDVGGRISNRIGWNTVPQYRLEDKTWAASIGLVKITACEKVD